MIRKFRPEDLEECLMAMPIENWKFVDEASYDESDQPFKPIMMISHLSELKGIEIGQRIKIKAFTHFDVIKSNALPKGFLDLVELMMINSKGAYKTIGCHLLEEKKAIYLLPYLSASDATISAMSYMKEREVDFDAYTQNSIQSICRYDEILYEISFNNVSFDINIFDTISCELENETLLFSYYLGADVSEKGIENIVFSIMLSSGNVLRCSNFERVLSGHSWNFDDYLKQELKKLFYRKIDERGKTKYGSKELEIVFDCLIWSTINKMKERYA